MFGFNKIDRSKIQEFNKNYLRNVVLQVKFDKKKELHKKIEVFKDVFEKDFPRYKELKGHELNVTIGKDQTPVVQPSSTVENGFELRSESGNKSLNCSLDAVTLNIAGAEYLNFEQLKPFISKLQELLEKCELGNLARISIRKINIIDFSIPERESITPYELMEYILNKDLVGRNSAMPNASSIKQSIQNLSLAEEDYLLNLKYGMLLHNWKDQSGQIIVDIDCIKNNAISIDDLPTQFELINDEIFNIFNWSLSEEALKELLKKG